MGTDLYTNRPSRLVVSQRAFLIHRPLPLPNKHRFNHRTHSHTISTLFCPLSYSILSTIVSKL